MTTVTNRTLTEVLSGTVRLLIYVVPIFKDLILPEDPRTSRTSTE